MPRAEKAPNVGQEMDVAAPFLALENITELVGHAGRHLQRLDLDPGARPPRLATERLAEVRRVGEQVAVDVDDHGRRGACLGQLLDADRKGQRVKAGEPLAALRLQIWSAGRLFRMSISFLACTVVA